MFREYTIEDDPEEPGGERYLIRYDWNKRNTDHWDSPFICKCTQAIFEHQQSLDDTGLIGYFAGGSLVKLVRHGEFICYETGS